MKHVEVFRRRAHQYDVWYDAHLDDFRREVNALAFDGLPRPRVEIGVGTGRFAEALDLDAGIDPSSEMLKIARERNVEVIRGLGEALPVSPIGTAYLIFTLCFIPHPEKVLSEVHNALIPDGKLAIGTIYADSTLGEVYLKKKEEGHVFYSMSTLLTREEMHDLLARTGFRILEERSAGLTPPDFTAMLAAKSEEH